MSNWQIVHDDVMHWAENYNGEPFMALLCDPPYELGFMDKDWDRSGIAFSPGTWTALAEHLCPGAFGMAFASSRGWHRLAVAIEDAGLRIHPSIFGWAYGSGFPKATRIDTQMDKVAGAEKRLVINERWNKRYPKGPGGGHTGFYGQVDAARYVNPLMTTLPTTPLARAWQGHRYGLQALKPALEPIIVFQRPYRSKPVECITETGAGALWIDGGRIGASPPTPGGKIRNIRHFDGSEKEYELVDPPIPTQGRWPANFCLVHHPGCVKVGTRQVGSGETKKIVRPRGESWRRLEGRSDRLGQVEALDSYGEETITAWDCVPDCPVRKLGEQSGELQSGKAPVGGFIRHTDKQRNIYGTFQGNRKEPTALHGDKGTAARFFFQADWNLENAEPVFYCAKASRRERDAGLEGLELVPRHTMSGGECIAEGRTAARGKAKARNPHPTVKPIALARWLATLLLPPPEYAPRRILIPFSGSGSEGIGAGLAGWDDITMIDNEAEYCQIAEARTAHWLNQPEQLTLL